MGVGGDFGSTVACGEPAMDAKACDLALSLSRSMGDNMVALGGGANAENLMALGL